MPSRVIRKPQDIAAVIRAARDCKGVTQEELAEELGFSRDYMVDLESGRANLYVARLFRVMHELGVKMSLEFESDHSDA